MKDVIVIDKLCKEFKSTDAVSDLSLKVPMGTIFAFLGPNGAGKTTTIKTLLNILRPTSGCAKVLNVDSKKLGPREFSRIGYVSENQEIPDWMSVKGFLSYCKTMYSTWDDAFAAELIEQFELPLAKQLKTLSRGMKMKAALVSSMAYHPQLLVLDEPFSGLDPLVRDEFVSGILEITQSKSWTIFISSHDINEVERLADRVAIIDRGRLKLAENTDDLQQRFRQVDILLDGVSEKNLAFPENWILPEREGRTLRFIDSNYREGSSEEKIKSLFPSCSIVSVQLLTLREIFIALAKQFKISAINEGVEC